jgi:uncharacterized membrane protein YdjX (TVP38/TMEM64 family)
VTFPPLLRTGLLAYEQGDFPAARAVWESAADGEGEAHELCRGLALLAGAYEQAREGRCRAAETTLRDARSTLEALPGTVQGIDLVALLRELDRPDALQGQPPRLLPSRGRLGRSAARFAIFVLVVLTAGALVRWGPLGEYFDRELLVSTLLALRETWWAPLALIAGFLVVAPLGLPASPLVLTGGVVFGAGLGTVYNMLGSLLGAVASFVVARTMGREFVSRVAGKRLKRVELLLARRGFWSMVGARLMPLPFSVVNFGAALAGVRPLMFVSSSLIGLLPPTLIYTYFAALLFEVAQGAPARDLWRLGLAMGLMFSVSLVPVMLQGLRRRRRFRELRRQRASLRRTRHSGDA